jgi:hypothetical protein
MVQGMEANNGLILNVCVEERFAPLTPAKPEPPEHRMAHLAVYDPAQFGLV